MFLRISPTGNASRYAKVKQNNKTLNRRLGSYPELPVAMARRANDEWIKTLSVVRNMSVNTSYTVKDAFHGWYEKKKLVARSFEYMKLRIERHIIPIFGSIQLKDLTAKAHEKIRKELKQ
ncbi:MAG: hypothetical protein IJ254_04605 [Succinivibrio sp.]|nr:hypothetical protein [Succinivibrio sp.]